MSKQGQSLQGNLLEDASRNSLGYSRRYCCCHSNLPASPGPTRLEPHLRNSSFSKHLDLYESLYASWDRPSFLKSMRKRLDFCAVHLTILPKVDTGCVHPENPRIFLAPETLMTNFDTVFQAVEGEIFLSSVSIAFYLREILESFYWRSKLWEHNRKSLQHDSSDYFLLFCCCCAHIATAGELTTPPRLQRHQYFVIQTSRNTRLPRRRSRRR